MKLTSELLAKFAKHAAAELFVEETPTERAKVETELKLLLTEDLSGELARLSPQEQERLPQHPRSRRATQAWWDLILLSLGLRGLRLWASAHSPPIPGQDLERLARDWLEHEPEAQKAELLVAAARFALNRSKHAERRYLDRSFKNLIEVKKKELKMAVTFIIDRRGTPPGFDTSDAGPFSSTVETKLKSVFGLDKAGNVNIYAYVKGSLLAKGYFDTGSSDFIKAMDDARKETLRTTVRVDNNNSLVSAEFRELLDDVATAIENLPDRAGTPISVQEYAFVAGYVFDNASQVPLGHPNFGSQVRLGLDKYVSGAPASDSLALPPLTGDGGTDVEIEKSNIESVAIVYAAYQLERMAMFRTVDFVSQLFNQGLLPIGYDAAGRALDKYYWDAFERLKPGERMMIYTRVLGAAGGEVSKQVGPNKEFDNLWMRVMANFAEYDRQQRMADLFDNRTQTSLSLTGEQVRKAVRDLAANVSLRGWAGTQASARRINLQIVTSLDLLKQPSLLKAYGVSNPYQVIERVAAQEFGQTPNIVKYRTMADAGYKILNLIAKYSLTWAGTSGLPLFPDRKVFNSIGAAADITDPQDIQTFFTQTQYWLAVNGIGDDQVVKMSQPSDTAYSPSIPTLGSAGSNGSGDAMEKIKQMVQAGNTPTLEQLLPAFRA